MNTACPGIGCTLQVQDPDIVCDVCWTYRHVLRADLPGLWGMAQTMLPPGSNLAQNVSGGAGPGSKTPLRMSVLSAMETALLVVETWASVVLERIDADQLPPRTQVRAVWLWETGLDVLNHHDETLSNSWLGTSYYGAMYKARRRLAEVTGVINGGVIRLTDPCPSCGRMSVVVRNRGDHIACLTCGSQWGQSAYQAITRHVTRPLKAGA